MQGYVGMKKKIWTLVVCLLISSAVMGAGPIAAAQFEFYPRLEAGIMAYKIQYEALSSTALSMYSQSSGRNSTRDKVTYSDNLSFIGGGATFCINRLFIDLYGQYAFEGSDRQQASYSAFKENINGDAIFATMCYERKGTFDHTDYAIAVGYAISKEFSVFAGYKWANADMFFIADGLESFFFPEDPLLLTGDNHLESDVEFKYEGPFVGVIQGWKINPHRFLKGVITAKVGVAYLNSKYVSNQKAVFIGHYDKKIDHNRQIDESKGDTWGFNFGIGWRGMTPIENLSYSLDIGGYRYSFDSNSAVLGTINESVVSYKAGICYVF